MKKRIAQVFLGLMALAFCKTGIEAISNPQAVLTQVGILLENNSALSSMRAVYGGMHLVFGFFCMWGIMKDVQGPLVLIILYTLGFTIGRVSGIIADGLPNEFVITWLITEIVSGAIAGTLLVLLKKEGTRLLN